MEHEMKKDSSKNLLHRFFKNQYSTGIVSAVERITPSTLRIQIHCDSLDAQTCIPGQHVRIQINDPLSVYGLLRPVETLRSYTVWEWSRQEQFFELRVHLYEGDGIGLKWAREVNAGDEVTFWGPMGDFTIIPGAYHVFVGEETATAAFGPMIRSLGPTEKVYGVLESNSAQDELSLPHDHHLSRVYRHGASPVSSSILLDAVAALDLPDHPGSAYIAGEAETCKMILSHLVQQRGWTRSSIKVKPFWTPGKRGLH